MSPSQSTPLEEELSEEESKSDDAEVALLADVKPLDDESDDMDDADVSLIDADDCELSLLSLLDDSHGHSSQLGHSS